MDSDITDYSLFEDKKLEILSGYDVFEYGLPDLSQTMHLHIPDKSVNLKTMARVTSKMTQIDRYRKAKDMWEKKKIIMGWYADGSKHFCSYDLDKKNSVSKGMKGKSRSRLPIWKSRDSSGAGTRLIFCMLSTGISILILFSQVLSMSGASKEQMSKDFGL